VLLLAVPVAVAREAVEVVLLRFERDIMSPCPLGAAK